MQKVAGKKEGVKWEGQSQGTFLPRGVLKATSLKLPICAFIRFTDESVLSSLLIEK
jgi:hypothetical protein